MVNFGGSGLRGRRCLILGTFGITSGRQRPPIYTRCLRDYYIALKLYRAGKRPGAVACAADTAPQGING